MSPADTPRGVHHGAHHGRRPFSYGALRLIVLDMIAEAPRHGYELIKAIEERMGGGYSPSPGVIYPTLSWLEDMGYAVPEAEGGRKSYRITPDGAAFLEANRGMLAEIGARMGARGSGGRGDGGRRNAPEPVLAAMDGLKRALRARFAGGAVDAVAAGTIAAAIRAAAETVEKTMAPKVNHPSHRHRHRGDAQGRGLCGAARPAFRPQDPGPLRGQRRRDHLSRRRLPPACRG